MKRKTKFFLQDIAKIERADATPCERAFKRGQKDMVKFMRK